MMNDVIRLYYYIICKVYVYILKLNSNISIGKNVKFTKIPLIYIDRNSKLIIGDNVVINSDNSRYHLNMHSASKIILDKPGGIIIIGNNCRIHGTCIHAYKSVTIGNNCLIAANTQIIDGNGHELSFPNVENRIKTVDEARPIIIEDNVWIGANVIVLPGVTIGAGSVIAAGSIVSKDIPPMAVAGGNPARVIKDMNSVTLPTL